MSETQEPKNGQPKHRIFITGDVLVDHHIYEGERRCLSEQTLRGLKAKREHGGACLIHRLLQACFDEALAIRSEKVLEAKKEIVRIYHERAALKARGNPDKSKIIALRKAFNAANKSRRLNAGLNPQANSEAEWSSHFVLKVPDEHAEPCAHHALATWKPFPLKPGDKNNETKVWRAEVLMGYGHDEPHSAADGEKPHCDRSAPELVENLESAKRIVVLDDGGFLFRQEAHRDCWLLPQDVEGLKTSPDWYVLKLSAPVAQGDLWRELEKRHRQEWTSGEVARPDVSDRLVVMVSAADLRRESGHLSCGLSWESTVEDLRALIGHGGALSSLARLPRHLIVSFDSDGALWLDNSDAANPKAHLIYDADGAEGQWAEVYDRNGEAFGYLSCLTASVTRSLALQMGKSGIDLKDAIAAGLSAMRDLRQFGHGVVETNHWPTGFPTKRLARVINQGTGDFANHRVPWTDQDWAPYRSSDSQKKAARVWRILESSQVPFGSSTFPSMVGLARQFVIYGTKSLKHLPHARFGGLITADRGEMETLRSLRRLMLAYKADKKASKPLSIGIFGPPGAGKSFGVRQVATDKTVFGEDGWVEFNLSQFRDSDLIGAFHQIRDLVLKGTTPVVFWDEFDSSNYHWLQYLLAPMQDGRFQEQQITHPIGKCVFIFAGGTAHSFETFGPPKDDPDATKDFRLKKGPDFHSRLDAYYNVLGPNQRELLPSSKMGGAAKADNPSPTEAAQPVSLLDPADICTPLRRAIMIRHQLGLSKSEQRLDIDRSLLDALLKVGRYKHGARSLEKLVAPLAPARPYDPVRPSHLPPPAIQAMHLEPLRGDSGADRSGIHFADFLTSRKHDLFSDASTIERLAEWIHLSWKAIYPKNKPSAEEPSPHSDKTYWDLSEEGKEDNRAAARRIPDILALVGLTVIPREGGENDVRDSVRDPAIQEHLRHHVDLLAQAEHDGWMDRKVISGWRYGKIRNDAAKIHDCLIPFSKLAKHQKDKDRDSVLHFQEHLWRAGYRIVFAESEE